MSSVRNQLDRENLKLVFTNGCFDILHAGHVRYLEAARSLGDALVVAVNGDESVRALKGEGRPLNSEDDRAEVICALGCVDYALIFPDVRVTKILRTLRPHVYVKGGDYTPETLNAEERAAIEETGSEIKIVPLLPGRSTSGIIRKLNAGSADQV
ncbi:MAG: adenylyltransferase/cytidyltransferase family protein [Verrucomicrobiota bacterium]|nr:adenylyltransferase/cytidyltransferase family protein [Verrucomicrobiota bacterium]